MGQSSSAERARELKEHLQELHNFDPKVTGLRDELLNLVKKHYDHCERDSQATGENRRVPLPNCRHCAPELAIFHDHVHNFHEKLKAYTSHHPPIWAEGEEARHKKHAEQLSSYASNLMHEMKGIIEAETERDRADPVKVHDFAKVAPVQPTSTPHVHHAPAEPALVSLPEHHSSHGTQASGSAPPAGLSAYPTASAQLPGTDSQLQPGASQPGASQYAGDASQFQSAASHARPGQMQYPSPASQYDAAASQYSQGPGQSHAGPQTSEDSRMMASAHIGTPRPERSSPPVHQHHDQMSAMPPSVAPVDPHQHPANQPQARPRPAHVEFAREVTMVSAAREPFCKSPAKSPGTDDVFDPDAVSIPAPREDKTPHAEQPNPFADDFKTLEARLPEEAKLHPLFPYPRGSAFASAAAVPARPLSTTYECDSIDSDSGSRASQMPPNGGKHRVQPTMENAMPDNAGVDIADLQQRLAHLPTDSPPRKGQHRPEPSLIDAQPIPQDHLDAQKLRDRLSRVDMNVRHKIQDSMASLDSIEERAVQGEELAAASNRTTYTGSSRALQDSQSQLEEDDEDDPDYDPTLSQMPNSSKWGSRRGPDRVDREIESALNHYREEGNTVDIDGFSGTNASRFETIEESETAKTPSAAHPHGAPFKDTVAVQKLGNHVIGKPVALQAQAAHQAAGHQQDPRIEDQHLAGMLTDGHHHH